MSSIYRLMIIFCLTGCGLQSTIPADSSDDSSDNIQAEKAVSIVNVVSTSFGHTVTCEINPAIISASTAVPVFLEFEGTEIERITQTNESHYTFTVYDPPSTGDIICVAIYADAEFESDSESIDPAP